MNRYTPKKPLSFIRFYVDDYMADTMHLSAAEHGAYHLIMWNYWKRQRPPEEHKLPAISKLGAEFEAHRDTLAEFFEVVDNVWHHNRIESELQRVRDESKRNKKAGKQSAKVRKERVKIKEVLTGVEHALNTRSTNVQQIIRSNELSAKTVPLKPKLLTKAEENLMAAREVVWQLEKDIARISESESVNE